MANNQQYRTCPKCGKMGYHSHPDTISRGLKPYNCKSCGWDIRNAYAPATSMDSAEQYRTCPKCGKMGYHSHPDTISRGLKPYNCKSCGWDIRNAYIPAASEEKGRAFSLGDINRNTLIGFAVIALIALPIAVTAGIYWATYRFAYIDKEDKDKKMLAHLMASIITATVVLAAIGYLQR